MNTAMVTSGYNTSFRPTPYADMHVGHVWNALLNWAGARSTGGEFVFIVDTLCHRWGNAWPSGYSPATGEKRYCEDLEWLGMKPDRVEWSRGKPDDQEHDAWRRERHHWAVERLCGAHPQRIGALIHKNGMSFSEGGFEPLVSTEPVGGASRDTEARVKGAHMSMTMPAFSPFVTACCVVDDIDFGIQAWAGGRDLICGWGWTLDAYMKLDALPRKITWHKCFVRGWDSDKIRKSDPACITVRQLREAGYTAKGILDTLCELQLRSNENFDEAILVPPGVLELDDVTTLEFRHRGLEDLAAGRFIEGGARIEPWKPEIMAEAARQLIEEVGKVEDL